MNKINFKKQSGIGLIEVLIAVLVVALGLILLASFEGNLLKTSGQTKARSEAITIAEQKIEEYRNSIQLGAGTPPPADTYSALSSGNDTINGTNANFSRVWTITNKSAFLPGAPPRKEISVLVSWNSVGIQDEVRVVSEIAWIDPAKSIQYASDDGGGTAAVPSPRQNASEDVAAEKVFNTPSSSISSGTPGVDSSITLNEVTSFDQVDEAGDPLIQANVQLTQIAPDSRYYSTDDTNYFFVEPGVIAVFLCNENSLDCRYIQNHFGGVSHRIRGKVYSNTGTLNGIGVAWTSSDVNACYVSNVSQETKNGQSVDVKNYECVHAGNCDMTSTKDGIGNGNGCSTNVTNEQIAERNVGPGGEFGDVGLLGLDSQGGGREKVCFLEDTSDYESPDNVLTYSVNPSSPEDYYLPVTKRLYVARSIENGRQASEGINRSYSNHNFMIVERGNVAGSYQNCFNTLFTVSGGNPSFEGYNLDPILSNRIALAQREVVRVLSSQNQVEIEPPPYDGGTGESQTIVQRVTSDPLGLRLYISEVGTCYLKSDNTMYACAVPSDVISAKIQGGLNQSPGPNVFDSCTKTINDGTNSCEWPFSP